MQITEFLFPEIQQAVWSLGPRSVSFGPANPPQGAAHQLISVGPLTQLVAHEGPADKTLSTLLATRSLFTFFILNALGHIEV